MPEAIPVKEVVGAGPLNHPIGLPGRVAAFRKGVAKGPVKVNLYGREQEWRSLSKLVTAVAILVGGVVVGQQLNQKTAPGLSEVPASPVLMVKQACEPGNVEDPVASVKLIEVNYQGKRAMAIDEFSRVRLSKQAAKAHALHDMGLGWEDVYAVINAETAWIPRSGSGKNKVTSHGLAQFEPATAKALGVADPNDPVHAVNGAAALIREAAEWSKGKISHLQLKPSMRDAKLREGISVYYNLSSAGRRQWNGANLHDLPVETQYHVANFKDGRNLARMVERRVDAAKKTSLQPILISVQAASESALLDPQLCQAAISTGLGLVAAEAIKAKQDVQENKPYLVTMAVDGVKRDYVAPQSVHSTFQAAAQSQKFETGWRSFFASTYQTTGFELKALKNASGTSSFKDLVDRGFILLAQGWKAAEDWSISKGARSAMQKACGIAAFQSLATKECAQWSPASALDSLHGHRSTLLMALTIFKEMQDDAPTPLSRDKLTKELIDQVGFLDGGGSVELLVEKALALHAFEAQGVDQLGDVKANARFMQTLAKDGYTMSDLLRLYRAALDARMVTVTPDEGVKMIMAVSDQYTRPWDEAGPDVRIPEPT